MIKIVFVALLLLGCSVIKRPGRSVDSVIVTRDSFHTTVAGRDSVIYRKRDVSISHEHAVSFRPLFWYSVTAALALTLYLFIKK